jgi:hypothetical protein
MDDMGGGVIRRTVRQHLVGFAAISQFEPAERPRSLVPSRLLEPQTLWEPGPRSRAGVRFGGMFVARALAELGTVAGLRDGGPSE